MAADDAIRAIGKGQVAIMMAVVTIAGAFAEALVKRGILSAVDAQSVLSDIAEEIRDDGDGDAEGGRLQAQASYMLASEIEKRAIAMGEK